MASTWADLGSGDYTNPELSSKARMLQALESRFFDIVEPADDLALGKNHGDKVAWKIFGRVSGTATSPLTENQTVPFAVLPEYEVSTTVYERGLALSYTGQREDLDRLSIKDPIIKALKDSSSRTHNKLIYDALAAGRSFCYTALTASTRNFTTNGTPTGTAAIGFSAFHAREVVKDLEKVNTPKFDGKGYVCIGSPTMIHGLITDTASGGFIDVKKYTSEADGLLTGEIGSFFGTRYIKDNDVLNGSLDAIGTGSAFGSGFFLGAEACKEITVYPMELRANSNLGGDFGRQAGIAWLSLLGYKTVKNYTAHGEGTVCHYTTA